MANQKIIEQKQKKVSELSEKIKEANLEKYLFAPALVDRIFSSGGFKDLVFRNSRLYTHRGCFIKVW